MLMLYEYSASSKRKIIKSNYITGENETFKLSVTMSSNFQRTFRTLLSQPLMSSTILLPFNTHLDFLHSYLLHYTQLQLPLQQPPHHQFRLLLRCPSSTQLFLQHPQLMDPFGLSLRLVEKPKLVHEGHSYSYHKQRTSGYILWRCDVNNKAAREKGISCNATALTTGDLPISTIEWSRPHSHAPDSGKIGAISVRESMKTDAVSQHADDTQDCCRWTP